MEPPALAPPLLASQFSVRTFSDASSCADEVCSVGFKLSAEASARFRLGHELFCSPYTAFSTISANDTSRA